MAIVGEDDKSTVRDGDRKSLSFRCYLLVPALQVFETLLINGFERDLVKSKCRPHGEFWEVIKMDGWDWLQPCRFLRL